ncbi:MAG TPA: DUF4383 domain-containing protein [Actinophytocola sp.]|uniref:DUF4383 domain-containing protein n=1 Tax=Actinophytocola sp. TaxID=1872138 RepID=UPI002DDD93FF|nr:DUF4383 domain-containing protein [Actinophytocola sp.]HEV2781042.1 DUF4383 domain-containing protein [Actinophytocola sp.]
MTSTPLRTSSVNRLAGYAFGAVYLLVGLVGFAITTGVGLADTHGKHLIIFELNPLHNIVHIAIGLLLGFAAYRGAAAASVANSLVGGVYLLVGILGLFLTDSAINILAINHPDNALHLASALVLLGVGLSKR